MDVLVIIIAVALGFVGLLGCIVPVIPGPPLSYLGLLTIYLWHDTAPDAGPLSGKFMLVWLGITVAVTILDYIVPVLFTKVTRGSKEAVRWSIAGTIVGMLFFPPFGIIIGAFLGAFLGEIIVHNKNLGASLLSGMGSLLGFVFGIGIKFAASGTMMYYIFKFI
jgi:uncharacterized protein YqgC (DUF456 family)